MKRCPICRNTFPGDQARFCPVDGAELEAAPPPPPGPPPDPLVGTTLEGKYRIESRLGAGGMGAVYKAHHLLLGRDVAVKVLKSGMLADPRAAERFRREAQAAARLEHPNAVTIYDFGISADGNAYLVMELLRGTSLRDVLDRDRILPVGRVVEIFSKVCSAIDRAHELGIVHRDLKPDNVMVDERPDGSTGVKVVDFGIAMLQDLTADSGRLTGTGMVVGTANYMSPEHCRGQEVDPRSDIYSLGVMLYEMLTGRVPFDGPVASAVIVAHVSDPPPPPRAFRPELPPAVEQVALDALAKRPGDRPQSAGELAARFELAARGAPRGDATLVASSAPNATIPVAMPLTEAIPRPGTDPRTLEPTTGAASGGHPPAGPPSGAGYAAGAVPPGGTPPGGYPGGAPPAGHPSHGAPSGPAPHTVPVRYTQEPEQRPRRSGLAVGIVALGILAVGGAALAATFGILNWREAQTPSAPADPGPRPLEPDKPPVTPSQPPARIELPPIPSTLPESDPSAVDPGLPQPGAGDPLGPQPSGPQPGPADPGMNPIDPGARRPLPTRPTGSRPLTAAERGEVEQFLADWISSSESMDIEWHMRHYAERVDYYRAGLVPRDRVRADRERAYARFDQLELRIPRIHEASVAPDGSVRLVFDKEWEFVGPSGDSRGKVKQVLVLRREGGTFVIVAERDLQVY